MLWCTMKYEGVEDVICSARCSLPLRDKHGNLVPYRFVSDRPDAYNREGTEVEEKVGELECAAN